ncbi:MAG: 6-bladed beta-propeller [Gammaproteobacteria bacterium]|nr:6-bladed beta-propeller [Gammaproteobacteria bacterium]
MLKVLFSALLGCALLGCATAKHHLEFGISQGAVKVWPQAPETARYRYVGELTGEENFKSAAADASNFGVKLFSWIVGLTSAKYRPTILQRPQTGTVDELGNIYVTDASRQAVYKFDRLQGTLQVWDMAATDARMQSPVGIVSIPGGQMLVADAGLGVVIRLDAEGKPLGFFGLGVLARPTGLARDEATGKIYVADTKSHDIKMFDRDGQLLGAFGGHGEAAGMFNGPTHLAFADGQLYVTDTFNARIQIFTAEGEFVRTFGRRGLNVGDLPRPKGVAVDNTGNIYVVESFYDRLLVFDSQGDLLLSIGSNGAGVGQFYLPAGVWVDKQNRVYVADMFNGRVVIFQYLQSNKLDTQAALE